MPRTRRTGNKSSSNKAKKVSGIVAKIYSKKRNTKNGRKLAYSFILEDSETWINMGFDRPDFAEGAEVECRIFKNDYGYQVKGDVTVLEDAPDSDDDFDDDVIDDDDDNNTVDSSKTVTQKGYWGRREQRDLDNDLRITYVGARNSAINVITAAISADALPLGAKANLKLGKITDAVDELTNRFFNEAMDLNRLDELLEDSSPDAESDDVDDDFEDDDD